MAEVERELVAQFFEAALPDPEKDHRAGDLMEANRILLQMPAIAHSDIYAAALLGEAESVHAFLEAQPELASQPGGPRAWEPLLYLSFSRYLRLDESRLNGFVKAAGYLLGRGADPNCYFLAGCPPVRETPLYGACGVAWRAEVGRLLLEAGANPNDNESLYHSCECPDHDCLMLLCEYGVDTRGTNALKRKLDFEDPPGLKLLLEHGADPDEGLGLVPTPLHHAIRRGRKLESIALLVNFGASVDARTPEGESAWEMASNHGATEIAEYLEGHGARPVKAPEARFAAACAAADAETARQLVAEHPDVVKRLKPYQLRALPEASASGRTGAVQVMLESGFPPDARGDLGGTALHWAAWNAQKPVLSLLIQEGAPLNACCQAFQLTALGWTVHAYSDGGQPPEEYLPIARALLEAGAACPPGLSAPENSAMAELLEEFRSS